VEMREMIIEETVKNVYRRNKNVGTYRRDVWHMYKSCWRACMPRNKSRVRLLAQCQHTWEETMMRKMERFSVYHGEESQQYEIQSASKYYSMHSLNNGRRKYSIDNVAHLYKLDMIFQTFWEGTVILRAELKYKPRVLTAELSFAKPHLWIKNLNLNG
jgi:hypothetical protein